ncbi:MAG TPA: ABC transporter permease [Verrucomicrobiae bacterium]|nr:ABC transporter permease [Verrucomicrobiae bacterium]
MTTYILRRLLWVLPSLFVVFTLTFVLVHATPGSPWDESDKPLPAAVKESLAHQYHLDDPLPKQYFDYLANVLRGDFGPSYRSVERSVSEIIGATLPVSAQLGLASMLFAVVVGVPLGALAAVKHNTWIDYVSSLVTVTGLATPPFVRVSLLIVFFSLALGWLPTGGWEGIFDVRAIIPILAIGLGPAAILARYTRSSLLEVNGQDFIRTARAKGLTETAVVVRHALKNALIPVVTVAGVTLANVITGAFFVERIYSVPGIGRQFVDSVSGRDYPLLLGIVLVFALLISLVNLLVDLSYGFLDPRIRYR